MNILMVSLARAEHIRDMTKSVCANSLTTYAIIGIIGFIILICLIPSTTDNRRPILRHILDTIDIVVFCMLILVLINIYSPTLSDNNTRLTNIKCYYQMKHIKHKYPSIVHYKANNYKQIKSAQTYYHDKKEINSNSYGFVPQKPRWWNYL